VNEPWAGQLSDAEEIGASLEEPERFAIIFDRHFIVIRDYLRRRLSLATADELAAETFLIAFRRRSAYDRRHPSSRAWLFGIAVNLLHRHGRQERRELRAYARSANDLVRQPAGPEAPLAPVVNADLARAIRALSRTDREVLFLYACAELSYDEISRALEIPIGTVRSRLSRARRRIRELLGGEEAIGSDVSVDPEGAR
jgi:RNA polymerase sigma factor (sigma-70 family)